MRTETDFQIGERIELDERERNLAEIFRQEMLLAQETSLMAAATAKNARESFWNGIFELHPEWRKYRWALDNRTLEMIVRGREYEHSV
jgi:hypothetical protein